MNGVAPTGCKWNWLQRIWNKKGSIPKLSSKCLTDAWQLFMWQLLTWKVLHVSVCFTDRYFLTVLTCWPTGSWGSHVTSWCLSGQGLRKNRGFIHLFPHLSHFHQISSPLGPFSVGYQWLHCSGKLSLSENSFLLTFLFSFNCGDGSVFVCVPVCFNDSASISIDTF